MYNKKKTSFKEKIIKNARQAKSKAKETNFSCKKHGYYDKYR